MLAVIFNVYDIFIKTSNDTYGVVLRVEGGLSLKTSRRSYRQASATVTGGQIFGQDWIKQKTSDTGLPTDCTCLGHGLTDCPHGFNKIFRHFFAVMCPCFNKIGQHIV